MVLVDIVPNMDLAGASRIHAFMAERVESGFGSLDEVADVIANYNPHRPRPSDPDGLVANLRRRGDRWYWHWDPQFIGGIAAFPPVEVTDVDRMNAAVATILRDEVPVLLVRGQVSDIVRQAPTNFSRGFRKSSSPMCAAPDIWSPAIATTLSQGRS